MQVGQKFRTNLLLRVDGRVEVLEKRAGLDGVAVDEDLEGVVGLDDEGVEVGGLLDGRGGGKLEVLLLVLAGLGVLVAEDEVDLEARSALALGVLGTAGSELTFVPGQVRSGPNMIVHGVLSSNSRPAFWKPSSSSLMYPPPQLPPCWYLTSYWITSGSTPRPMALEKGAEMAWCVALDFATRPRSPMIAG